MTQFHEGQEVEVAPLSEMFGAWRKAKIVEVDQRAVQTSPIKHLVEFADGTRGVFDADHIRSLTYRGLTARNTTGIY